MTNDNFLSIALPISIIRNKRTLFHKSIIIANISRICAIYKVRNIYVYNDQPHNKSNRHVKPRAVNSANSFENSEDLKMIKTILEYMDCPQYLRKYLYGQNEFLRFAGILEPLGIPSHPLISDICPFRQAVLKDQSGKDNFADRNLSQYHMFDVGLTKLCIVKKSNRKLKVDKQVVHNIKMHFQDDKRLFYKFAKGTDSKNQNNNQYYSGELVDDISEISDYWGYKVHAANNLSEIFLRDSDKKFSLILGTSHLGNYYRPEELEATFDCTNALIVFGGIEGLEYCFRQDDLLQHAGDPSEFFDAYVNVCPNQGTRTIRTEEAIAATLSLFNTIFT